MRRHSFFVSESFLEWTFRTRNRENALAREFENSVHAHVINTLAHMRYATLHDARIGSGRSAMTYRRQARMQTRIARAGSPPVIPASSITTAAADGVSGDVSSKHVALRPSTLWRIVSRSHAPCHVARGRLLTVIAVPRPRLHDCHQLRRALLPCEVEDRLTLLLNRWIGARINQHLRDDGVALQDGKC